LEKAKLDYLIQYLEAIIDNEEFNKNGKEKCKDYAYLLFNSYIVQEKIGRLKEFIRNKNKKNSYIVLKVAIDICLETQNTNLALSIAKQKKMNEEILEILIMKMNKINEALDHLLPPKEKGKETKKKINNINNYIEEENDVKEKIYLILKYGEHFLKEKNGQIPDIFFNRVSSFLDDNKSYLDQKDIIKLIQIFIVSDKYFKSLFDRMDVYGIEYNSKIIHRRIELYLEDKENDYKLKIAQMLTDKKYMNKYDTQYLRLLFKYQNFTEGIDTLNKIIKKKQDVIDLYMSKHNYDKLIEVIDEIINNFDKNKDKNNFDINTSFIPIILNYFIVQKKKSQKGSKTNYDTYIQKIINKVSNLSNNMFIPADFLDIVYNLDNEFTIKDITFFMNNCMNKELVSIGTYLYRINEIKKQLTDTENKIKELNTKAVSFNLKKCDECDMSINFPCICFFCGHCFHQLCVNSVPYDSNDNNNNNEENKIITSKMRCQKCIKLQKK
jgi:hypothetical protein